MKCTLRILPIVLLALAFPSTVLGQSKATVPDPDPEIERKSFKIAEGFEVNLFAADPLLAKPIQMNFDAAGRLWVATSETYPQIKPGQKANDKIIILEDTRGVGKADKVTVFADGLLIPTGLEPGQYQGRPGVYVANSTDLLHLADTKGTGKADSSKVVLSGFGTEDTHHLLHTLRWGHDGNLYMNQSVYIHSHLETPHGVRRLGGGGIWQLRPDTLELEVFMRGLWNGWGHHFDRWGQSFATDGAGTEGIYPVVIGAGYPPAPAPRILHGLNPGSPKYCGLEIVSGRHLPDDWQGNLITNDFRANRVCRFTVAPSGSGYTDRLMSDLIRATHPAFRPVDVKMGPDGAIYIADWYNPIIQHGEVDFRDPRRDVTHGRIWRVTAKGRPLVARASLVDASVPDLLKQLEAPEGWTRHFARRVLAERGAKAVVPELQSWVKKLGSDPATEPHRLEALWTYQTLDVVEPGLLHSLLAARDNRVRAAAVRVAGAWQTRLPDRLELLAARVTDEHPQVRLEAVRALGRIPSVRSAELALQALERPVDEFIDYGLWLTLRELQDQWIPALQAGRFRYGNNVRRLTFALQAVGSERVLAPLVGLVRSGKIPAENEEGVLTLLAGVGGPNELGLVLERGTSASAPARQARLLAALEESVRQRGVKPAGSLKGLLPLLKSADEPVRTGALRLAGLYKLEEARPALVEAARDSKARSELRQAAFEGLANLGGRESQDLLDELTSKGETPQIRRLALLALVSVDLPRAALRARAILTENPGGGPSGSEVGGGVGEVFEAFLQRKGGANLLAKTLIGLNLPPDVAKVGVRTVRTSGRDAGGLTDVLTKAGKLTSGARVLSEKELKEMVAEVARLGDPARGERVYRRSDQLCLRCHAIGGAGGQVGPDLSSIGASAPVDYLIESLLQPSKAIKENYHALLVTTSRGQQYTGIKVRETPTTLILRTDQDKEVAIPKKDIEEQTPSKVSLMPEGLADTLTRQELLDLVRFLSELGRIGPYSVGKGRVARRWQALEPVPETIRQLKQHGERVVLTHPNLTWSPAYSLVSGALPLADVPGLKIGEGAGVVFLQTQLEASAAARVKLELSTTEGLRLWLDGRPLTVAGSVELDLAAGVHTLTLAVERSGRTESVRAEIEDTPAAAGVRFVGGK
jgi:putative heme-binding domain-containing protein